MKTLTELTGQNSGIVIFDNGEAILCNWASIDGIPRLFLYDVIGIGEEIEPVKPESVDDVNELIDGVLMIYCSMDDDQFEEEFRGRVSGKVYEYDNLKVIAPDGWD